MNPEPPSAPRQDPSPRGARVAVVLAVAAFSVWANLAVWVDDPRLLRFVPPFVEGLDANYNHHLGAEYWNIARALVQGKGFSNPFFVETGPTAWMAPVYPLLLAALLAGLGSATAVSAAVVLMKGVVLVLTGWLVVGAAARSGRRASAPLAAGVYVLWLASHFSWFFQLTHDVWLVLLVVDAVLLGAWALLERELSPRRAAAWGALGGVALLTSPIAGFAWAAVGLRAALRGPAGPRSGLAGYALALAVAGLVVSPWLVRNARVFGELVLVKSNLAYDVYQANYVSPDGIYDEPFFLQHPVWTTLRDPDSTYRRLGEAAFVAEYRARLSGALREQPERLVASALNRLLFATLLYKPYRPHLEGPFPIGRALVHAAPFLGLLVLWLRGGLAADPRLRVAVALYAAYLLPYLVAALYVRYLLPLTPVLVLFTAGGAEALVLGRAAGDNDRDHGR